MALSRTEYNTIHQWVLRHYTKTGVCEHCGSNGNTEWSNKSGAYMRQDRGDWQELCRKCHTTYDTKILGSPSAAERGAKGGRKSRGGGFTGDSEAARRLGRIGGEHGRGVPKLR